jgi:uncharacterized protein
MNRRRFFTLLFVTCFAGVIGLHAEGAAEAKARMRERVPQIDQLKLAEAVGENNRGFLEARKPDAGAVVETENRDRTIVFEDAAKKAGSTAETIGRAFAKQIAAASKPGVWIQGEDGTWRKK